MIHWLKTEQPYFEDVWNFDKPFEIRKDDRKYQIDDILILAELLPPSVVQKVNTAPRAIIARVTSFVDDQFDGLNVDYKALGLVILGRISEDDLKLFEYTRTEISSTQWTSRKAAKS